MLTIPEQKTFTLHIEKTGYHVEAMPDVRWGMMRTDALVPDAITVTLTHD